jgi:hypothetical protein
LKSRSRRGGESERGGEGDEGRSWDFAQTKKIWNDSRYLDEISTFREELDEAVSFIFIKETILWSLAYKSQK